MQPETQIALSPKQAAAQLSLSRTKVFGLIKSGELTALKCGRRTLIPRVSIDLFLSQLEQKGEA